MEPLESGRWIDNQYDGLEDRFVDHLFKKYKSRNIAFIDVLSANDSLCPIVFIVGWFYKFKDKELNKIKADIDILTFTPSSTIVSFEFVSCIHSKLFHEFDKNIDIINYLIDKKNYYNKL